MLGPLFLKVASFGALLFYILVIVYLRSLGGPSFDTSSLGRYRKLVGNSTLYDNKLSNAEIDVICSVYKIATGE